MTTEAIVQDKAVQVNQSTISRGRKARHSQPGSLVTSHGWSLSYAMKKGHVCPFESG